MLDLKKALAIADLGLDTGKRFVICRYSDLKVGVLVDKIIDTITVDSQKIRVDTTKVLEKEFISGEYLLKKDIYSIIDIIKIIESTKA